MADNELEGLILVGKVSKAHGIRGEIKVYPYSGNPEQFAKSYRQLYLTADASASPQAYTVEQARVQGGQVLLKLESCSDRTFAETLKEYQVYAHSDNLPELDDDEFYLRTLEGKKMVDTSGKVLGTCSHFIDTGGQDLLVMEQNGKEYLIPVAGEFIVEIGEKQVVLDLPPGLLEING
jgi:16S rRNA processing protein RimM